VVLERPWLTASKNQKEEAMATKKKAKAKTRKKNATVTEKGADVPNLFRLNVEVGDLDEAAQFYGTLLGLVGRKQAGSRVYFTCGTVTLQVVDVSSVGAPHPAAKALSFTVSDLDAIFERAKSARCPGRCDQCAAVGRALVLRGGPVAEPALLRRSRDDLPWMKQGRRQLSKPISRWHQPRDVITHPQRVVTHFSMLRLAALCMARLLAMLALLSRC
jgi:hypothetical protein